MSRVEKKAKYSVEEYLVLEKSNDFKSEYSQGEIFAMSGRTINHSRIAVNITRGIGNALQGKKCEVFNSDLMVRIEAVDANVYPDVSIVCGPPEFNEDNDRILLNPTVVIEVLSETTERFDRGSKFHKYQTLPSLEEYIIVDQWAAKIDIFRPTTGGKWEWEGAFGMDAQLELKSIAVKLPLEEIFYNVTFPGSQEDV